MKVKTSQFCTNPEECPQCLAKIKFNIGAYKKCIKHAVLFQDAVNSINCKEDLLEEIMVCLQDAERMIHQYKQYNSAKTLQCPSRSLLTNQSTLSQFQDILNIIKRIQLQLGSVSQNQVFDSLSKNQVSYKAKSQKALTGVQKQSLNKFTVKTSEFDSNNEEMENIKKWVDYFSKILNKKNYEQKQKLPFINNLEMKLFCQDVQLKYKEIKNKIQQKDRQFNELINKLAHYIEKQQKGGKRSLQLKQQNKFLQKYVNLNAITPPRPKKINEGTYSNQKRSKTPNSKKSSQLIDASIILSNQPYHSDYIDQIGNFLLAQACSIQSLLGRIDQIQKEQQIALQ